MTIIHNTNKYKKLSVRRSNNKQIDEKLKQSEMYLQMAEACKNAQELSKQPWPFKKIHKLKGDKNNVYSFGVSKRDRTTMFGNERQNLPLFEVTKLEIIEYISDYHRG